MTKIQAIMWAFGELPFGVKVLFISSLMALSSGLYFGTISSIIFNYFIIPGIEKRFGKYFEYDPLYDYIFLSRWMLPQTEVALYIVRRYCALIFRSERGLPEKRNRFALKKIGYTIDKATKFEIIMSFLLALSVAVVAICGLIVIILGRQFPQFSS